MDRLRHRYFSVAASVSSIFYHLPDEPMPGAADTIQPREMHMQYALETCMQEKVAGVCLTQANFFALVCKWLNHRAVVWEVENLSTAGSNFTTHAMTEVFISDTGKPVLLDIDFGCYFVDPDGEPLSFEAFMEFGQTGSLAVRPLNNKVRTGFGRATRSRFNVDFLLDLHNLGGEAFCSDFYRILARSEIVLGNTAFGSNGQVTTPEGRARAERALRETGRSWPDDKRAILQKVSGLPICEFGGM